MVRFQLSQSFYFVCKSIYDHVQQCRCWQCLLIYRLTFLETLQVDNLLYEKTLTYLPPPSTWRSPVNIQAFHRLNYGQSCASKPRRTSSWLFCSGSQCHWWRTSKIVGSSTKRATEASGSRTSSNVRCIGQTSKDQGSFRFAFLIFFWFWRTVIFVTQCSFAPHTTNITSTFDFILTPFWFFPNLRYFHFIIISL